MDALSAIGTVVIWILAAAGALAIGTCAAVGLETLRRERLIGKARVVRAEELARLEP